MTHLEKQYVDKLKELIENYKSNYLSNPSSWASNNIKLESDITTLEAAIKEDEVSEVTDKEITEWVNKVQPVRGGYKSDYIFAAKWMRNKLTKQT